jgi:hypothetical protein
MTTINFKSAGTSARVINLTGPTAIEPAGIPAGVIGTSQKGPAFVPVTVPTAQDFVVDFGEPTEYMANAPLAAIEWLRNAQSVTFLKVLGAGNAQTRSTSGNNIGRVTNAGLVVGQRLPLRPGGGFDDNAYANAGDEGRLYFLGCFMKEAGSSTVFQDAGLPTEGNPIVRGVVMAPSGVLLTLSTSNWASSSQASSTGTTSLASGSYSGSLKISSGRQEFVMLLNGHSNTDVTYPNTLTASFDPTAPNYLTKILNTDPYKIEEAGHYLYADYKIQPAFAVPSGAGVITASQGAGTATGFAEIEEIAFLLSGSTARNVGSATVPSYENFEDRYQTAKTPWVISQPFGGTEENLFRISALDDGIYPNTRFKFSIEAIAPGTDAEPYGRFDLLVRQYDDNDKTMAVLEAFRGVSLNPKSPTYIARIIGDYKTFYNFDAAVGSQKLITEGTFPNKSRYIRVEMADKVVNAELDATALPLGFRGAPHLVTSGSGPMAAHSDTAYQPTANQYYNLVQIPVPFRETLTKGTAPSKTVDKALYWGVQFEEKTVVAEPNSTTTLDTSIDSFVKYFPNFQTSWLNFIVSNNQGAADTVANGIIDADRFLNNKFTLRNLRVTQNTTTGLVDTTLISEWKYIRQGNIAESGISRSLEVADLSDSAARNVAKFSFFLQGGWDGTNLLDRQMDNITNEAITEEMNYASRGTANGPSVKAFDKALDIFADSTEVDIQLMAIPGIRHSIITDRGLLVNEERFDSMFLMDIAEYDVNNLLVTSSGQTTSVRYTTNQFVTRGINNSFGATYFPNVVLKDSFTGKTFIVPPSVATLGAFSKNDALGHPWFAPAGFTRGALDTTEDSAMRLSRTNMDTLYENNINPIVSFAGSEGLVVWGQKTLLATDSALERVNVRRLLIDVRRKTREIANRMLFEPNRAETLARFTQLVNPVLKKIQDQNGVEQFSIVIDASTTTQADVENKTIRGKIFLQPTKTLEFLQLDFVVTNTSA